MLLNKIRLTNDSSERLKQLKGRTGLAPNILCRIGLCLSLADPAILDPDQSPEEDREFNRYTLLGEWDELYVALLRQRLAADGIPQDRISDYFRAHVNRGVFILSRFARDLTDVAALTARGLNSQDLR